MSFDRPCHGATGAAPPSSLPSNQCPSRMEKGSRRELHSSSTDSRRRSRSARPRSRTRGGPRIDRSKSNSPSSSTGEGPTDRSRSRHSRGGLPSNRSERRSERRSENDAASHLSLFIRICVHCSHAGGRGQEQRRWGDCDKRYGGGDRRDGSSTRLYHDGQGCGRGGREFSSFLVQI